MFYMAVSYPAQMLWQCWVGMGMAVVFVQTIVPSKKTKTKKNKRSLNPKVCGFPVRTCPLAYCGIKTPQDRYHSLSHPDKWATETMQRKPKHNNMWSIHTARNNIIVQQSVSRDECEQLIFCHRFSNQHQQRLHWFREWLGAGYYQNWWWCSLLTHPRQQCRLG